MTNEEYQKLLLQRIDEVLYYIWDPIGVSDMPPARDEYSSYADSVYRAVLAGKSKEDISAMLTTFTTERMELEARKGRDDRVAELILDWAEFLKEDNAL